MTRCTTRTWWLAIAVSTGACDDAEPAPEPPDTVDGDDDGDPEIEPAPGDDDDGGPEPPADDMPTPSFAIDVLPILQGSCSCHRGSVPEAGFDVTDAAAYDTLVFGTSSAGVRFVEPGDPDASYIVLKLRGEQAEVGGSGVRMPLGEPLAVGEQATIEQWVAGGVPE